jgi:hypothetical protein
LLLRPGLFWSTLIIYLPPALLSFWAIKNSRKKILIFSVISTVFFCLFFEFLVAVFNLWQTQNSVLKIWGLVNIENVLFFFFHQIMIYSSYELISDGDEKSPISRNLIVLLVLYLLFDILVILTLIFLRDNTVINYALFGMAAVLTPMLALATAFGTLIRKVLIVTIIWLPALLINELCILKLGYIKYTGEYLINFAILGTRLPLEEILFWIVLSTPAFLLGYEVFADDAR